MSKCQRLKLMDFLNAYQGCQEGSEYPVEIESLYMTQGKSD